MIITLLTARAIQMAGIKQNSGQSPPTTERISVMFIDNVR